MMNLLKKQEKRALEWLYEAYSPIVYGTIRRIGKTDEVIEDLLVKTYVNAWTQAQTIDIAKDRALPWIFNVLIDTIVEYAESVDPERKAFEISALKLNPESDADNYQNQLSRLERAIEKHFIVRQVPIAEVVPDDTKLQQSVMALRARMKINQVLMPR
jgi:DNA-directed RNA polymerase specialized sigma24 family protein